MTYTTIHLHLTPHPAATSLGAIEYACAAARLFEARLKASSAQLSIRAPSNWMTGGMLARIARELEATTTAKSAELETYLERRAAAAGIAHELMRVPQQWPAGAADPARLGRVSDLCVLGLQQGGAEPRMAIEDWIFGAGRPCLLYPETSTHAFSLENVLICWDFSRSAARAMNDALPLLHNAGAVHVAVFRGEKEIPASDTGAAAVGFLAAHGVQATAKEVETGGRTIGQAILDHAASISADLIVLGAFGHSRFQEFLLGGATKALLDTSPIPLLMSH
jgi:nucleotide-binding universal stress UspA family protein